MLLKSPDFFTDHYFSELLSTSIIINCLHTKQLQRTRFCFSTDIPKILLRNLDTSPASESLMVTPSFMFSMSAKPIKTKLS